MNTNTILYGIGERTRAYVEEHQNEHIIGILDGFQKDGEYCGIPVIPIENLVGANVKIVILARKASEKIIYDRIRDFCHQNHIPVYNAQMQKIEDKVWHVKNPYFYKNKDTLEKLIEEHEVVSFDIFDTLLIREVGDVTNVFRIAVREENSTCDLLWERIRAEAELSRWKCPTIAEIYGQLGRNVGIRNDEVKHLMEKEIEIEKKVLKPRKEVLQIYDKALESGKDVYLISDMYFSNGIIVDFLNENRIVGYKKLFVSCEYGKSKANGLYEIYKRMAGKKRLLHIGNDEDKDGKYAEKSGITAYTLLSPLDMAGISCIGKLCHNLEGIFQGISFTGLFENPFVLYRSKGKLQISDPYVLGYYVVAPALYSFVLWLVEKLNVGHIKDIYFVARDGFVIKQVFDLVAEEAFHTEYLPISRTLVMMACADTEERIRDISRMSFDGSMQDMLLKRFDLETDELLPDENGMTGAEYLEQHIPLIVRKAQERKRNYKKFLKQYVINENTAIFDFVSTGTCQMGLENILGMKLNGFYFEVPDNHRELYVTGFVNETGGGNCENYFLIEALIKECCPSLREVDASGKLIYSDRKADVRQEKTVRQVQRGILDYAKYMKKEKYEEKFSQNEAKAALELWKILDGGIMDIAGFEFGNSFDEFSNRELKII